MHIVSPHVITYLLMSTPAQVFWIYSSTNDCDELAKNGILNQGMAICSSLPVKSVNGVFMSKPHRSVVIDDEDINAYSPDYEDESQSFVTNEESQEDRHNNEEELDELDADDNAALLDEEEARLR